MSMDRNIALALQKRVDEAMIGAFYGTTSTIAEPQPALTLDTLRKMMLKIPKPECFLSTKLFPGMEAMHIEGSGENFTVAHPMFWARLEHECRQNQPFVTPNLLGGPSTFWGIRIIEIDPCGIM
jgi:hypothetical protein